MNNGSNLIVVNNPGDWSLNIPGSTVVDARTYLTGPAYSELRGVRVFNLCRSYRYQSAGYYVSLLAAARGHKPMPGVSTIQDMKLPTMIRYVSDDINDLIQKSLKSIQSSEFTLSIYFGKNLAKKYDTLSSRLFKLFQTPFLRAFFSKRSDGVWELKTINPIAASEIPEEHHSFVVEATENFFNARKKSSSPGKRHRYDMAILTNPAEANPPSNAKALRKFEKAAESIGIRVEFIQKEDYASIAEYDALFIRETTNVNHHTYRFARRATAEGLVVVDDPDSILRCTNKVYLAEILQRYKIRTPKTIIGHRSNWKTIPEQIEFPIILKQPDSSFSQGVLKVTDPEALKRETEKILSRSELFIAQEYLPTEYDWRIGIFNRIPLYACKYHMARGHWQIQGKNSKGANTYGNVDAIPIEEVPAEIMKMALRAANLIGNGLYGVDLKLVNNKSFVIEINDNPSIDNGSEDLILKDDIYLKIMQEFLERIERKYDPKRFPNNKEEQFSISSGEALHKKSIRR